MNICAFMRVTIFQNYKGGMEIHGKIIMESLRKMGHNVTIITTKHPKGDKYEEHNGIEYYFLQGVKNERYTAEWWKQSAYKFEELHKQKNFDIIWSQGSAGYGYLKYMKPKYNLPCISILHGTSFNELKTRWKEIFSIFSLFRWILFLFRVIIAHFGWESKLKNMDYFIAVSDQLKNDAIKEYNISPEKICFIPNGIDVTKFIPFSISSVDFLKGRFGINRDEKVLLYVGKIIRQKGIHIAIKALPIILKKFDGIIKLLIVGDGNYLNKAKRLVENLHLEREVVFCGFVKNEDLVYYYNLCDIFIMPTMRVEGFPLTVIEAMACGKPIITSRIGGIPSAIDDQINGILIPPGDVNMLAEKIILVLENKELREKLGKNAREKAVNEFNQDKMVSETMKIFEKCIKKKELH